MMYRAESLEQIAQHMDRIAAGIEARRRAYMEQNPGSRFHAQLLQSECTVWRTAASLIRNTELTSEETMPNHKTYLGDGLTAELAHGHVRLYCERNGITHEVFLDPDVLKEFLIFLKLTTYPNLTTGESHD
jgi:hypothetical protein